MLRFLRLLCLTSAAAASMAAAAPDAFPPAPTPVTPTLPTLPSVAKPHGAKLLEPKLRLKGPSGEAPSVALTFDACMGKVDDRILSTLVEHRIPATIFVTARWLKHNPVAFAVLRANTDLFEIEDHGENHVPAVDRPVKIYGIAAAGSPEAVAQEVQGGANAILAAGGAKPVWFRGATAKYTASSIRQIEAMGYKIAGYSINGDGGSLLGAVAAERQFSHAKDGDVIIAHINQPTHAAGEGVVNGILGLKAKGYRFLLLRDREETLSAGARAP